MFPTSTAESPKVIIAGTRALDSCPSPNLASANETKKSSALLKWVFIFHNNGVLRLWAETWTIYEVWNGPHWSWSWRKRMEVELIVIKWEASSGLPFLDRCDLHPNFLLYICSLLCGHALKIFSVAHTLRRNHK